VTLVTLEEVGQDRIVGRRDFVIKSVCVQSPSFHFTSSQKAIISCIGANNARATPKGGGAHLRQGRARSHLTLELLHRAHVRPRRCEQGARGPIAGQFVPSIGLNRAHLSLPDPFSAPSHPSWGPCKQGGACRDRRRTRGNTVNDQCSKS
jgi:hypothetical protein